MSDKIWIVLGLDFHRVNRKNVLYVGEDPELAEKIAREWAESSDTGSTKEIRYAHIQVWQNNKKIDSYDIDSQKKIEYYEDMRARSFGKYYQYRKEVKR